MWHKIEQGKITETDLYKPFKSSVYRAIYQKFCNNIFLQKNKNNQVTILTIFRGALAQENYLSFKAFIGIITWENMQTTRNLCDFFKQEINIEPKQQIHLIKEINTLMLMHANNSILKFGFNEIPS